MAKAPPWATLVATVSPLQPRGKRYAFGLGDIIPGLVVRVSANGDFAFSLKYQRDGCQKWLALGAIKVASGARTGLTRDQILLAGCRAVWNQASAAHLRLVAGEDPHEEHLHAKQQRKEEAQERARRVNLTFKTFLSETYFPHYLSQRRSGKATEKRLQSAFHAWLNRDISALTPWDLAKWRKERLDRGATPETVNRDVTALRSMMNWASHQGHIEANPLGRIRALGRSSDDRIRYLSPDERQRLQAALERSESYIAPLVTLAMHTGLRRGELFGLQWGDVDLERRILTLRLTTTKAAKTRHVPLNAEATKALERWQIQNLEADSDALVFPGRRGGRLVDIKHGFGHLMLEAGIGNFRFHDLRHEFASKLVMAGTDLNTVRELLGHADLTQTLRYAHLAPEHKRAAVARLENI